MLMTELLYILAFGVVIFILHLIFRKEEKESLKEFEEYEKEHESNKATEEQSVENDADKVEE
jgi:hypothetical protein